MQLDRRELFRIIGAGFSSEVLAQHHHGGGEVDFSSYKPRALSPAQYRTLDEFCELLLPADDMGPGAREAGVAFYLDTVLHHGEPARRDSWRKNLDALAAQGPLQLSIAEFAAKEAQPETELERFFLAVKGAAISAFFLSAAGKKNLGYTGDTAIPEFKGCTHNHQAG